MAIIIMNFRRAPWARGLAVSAIFAMLQSSLFAAEATPPKTVEQSAPVAITIDSEHLIELYQSVPGLRIIDSRLREDHAFGYIEKSLSLPLSETSCESLSKLTEDNEQALVFYCNGIDASTEAIHIASNCGYKRLFWLSGGFIEWQDSDYPYVID
jgi:rhodanese-related sulfurtransferase